MTDAKSRDRTRCHECGHLSAYHGSSQCLGAVEHLVGLYTPGVSTRCPCTLSVEEARVPPA